MKREYKDCLRCGSLTNRTDEGDKISGNYCLVCNFAWMIGTGYQIFYKDDYSMWPSCPMGCLFIASSEENVGWN